MRQQRIQFGGGAGRRQLREDVGQVRERRDPVLRAGGIRL